MDPTPLSSANLELTNSPPSPNPTDHRDLDPAAFLESVRELSAKREREDTERFQKLEAEVEKSRQERAARRAERARSVSPQKQHTPASSSSSRPLSRITTTPKLAPPPVSSDSAQQPMASTTEAADSAETPAAVEEVPEFQGFSTLKRSSAISVRNSTQSAKEPAEAPSQPSATNLARSGTLSWQQRRPTSRIGGSRPTSMIEPAKPKPEAEQDAEPTREQIAAKLGARDPSWFRQTSDRGAGSAAYRQSRDEATPRDSASAIASRRGLPGMSRDSSVDPSDSQGSPRLPESNGKSEMTSRVGSVRESVISSSSRFSTASSSNSGKPDLKSLIAADEAQQRASPAFEITEEQPTSSNRSSTLSTSQARVGSDRPASSTHGTGGFVQSAMLKRSESINKRWNSQSNIGVLSRPDSMASQRSSNGLIQGPLSTLKLEPTLERNTPATAQSTPEPASSSISDLSRPVSSHHSRSRSIVSNRRATEDEQRPLSPSSPSKRFSPIKSSWIESALQRPESPKPVTSVNSQPSWMANLAKANAQRASVDSVSKEGSQPQSPSKDSPFGPSILKRSSTKDFPNTTSSVAPIKPLSAFEKFTSTSAKPSPQDKAEPPPAVELAQQTERISTESPKSSTHADTEALLQPAGESTMPEAHSTVIDPVRAQPLEPQSLSKPKPDTAPKPTTDFRSNLRSRAPTESKPKEEPEFLSKVGTLRRTQQEKFVAPDVLKGNILRGKAELNVTGGPVKTVRKDEFKESINAKKDDMKKAKAEGRELPGQIHERKTSDSRKPPPKPEALAKKEMLSRSDSTRTTVAAEAPAVPEALVRRNTLKQKAVAEKTQIAPAPTVEAKFEPLGKQISAPAVIESKESSKLAARFNPGLAGLLARGPPTASTPPSRSGTPALMQPQSSEPQAEGEPLQDMRKDRAKGPKRRKGATAAVTAVTPSTPEPAQTEFSKASHSTDVIPSLSTRPQTVTKPSTSMTTQQGSQIDGSAPDFPTPRSATEEYTPTPKIKPQVLPGSAASIMIASMNGKSTPKTDPTKFAPSPRPLSVARSPMPLPDKPTANQSASTSTSAADAASPVPEFKGFGTSKPISKSGQKQEENNGSIADAGPPKVKPAGPIWAARPSPHKREIPAPIQLPIRKDSEAAMKSATALVTPNTGTSTKTASARSANTTPQASPGLPPKPAKSSRVVSGQMAESLSNPGSPDFAAAEEQDTEVGKLLFKTFGIVPKSPVALSIDSQAVISTCEQRLSREHVRTLRKSIRRILPDGSTESMPVHEEYTLFEESVYLCTHYFTNASGIKATQVFVWAGTSAPETTVEAATSTARRAAREHGGAPSHTIRQGQETSPFLQALGGILITRRGSRVNASKQYMLCGRKHLGHIVFDEVTFAPDSLCAGFVYLVSFPRTIQDTKVYLWKGSACSPEELSAARLAVMDVSETGEIIEVDGGVEFPSFLQIFGPATTKAHIPGPSDLWIRKAQAPNKFACRLFRVQQSNVRPSLVSNLWNRRPTWNSLAAAGSGSPTPSLSPARTGSDDSGIEVKYLESLSTSALETEGIYVLDAYYRLYVLIGPLFAQEQQQTGNAQTTLFAQALLFASDYAFLATSMEDRPGIPKCEVVFAGVPEETRVLFRQWDQTQGFWGTAGLMAGIDLDSRGEVQSVGLEDVLREVIVRD